jgi:hypothetical protein
MTCVVDVETGEGKTIINGPTFASKIAVSDYWAGVALVGYHRGWIAMVDPRVPTPVVSWFTPHNSDVHEVNCVVVHPINPFIVASATNTSCAYMSDLRFCHQRGVAVDSYRRDLHHSSSFAAFVPPKFQHDGIGGVAFSSSGRELLLNYKMNDIFSFDWVRTMATTSTSWADRFSPSTPEQPRHIPIGGPIQYRGRVNEKTMFKEATFMHGDRFVCSGGDCGRVYFWRACDGELIHTTGGDADIVNGVLVHEGLPVVVCCGIDETVKVLKSSGDLVSPAPSAAHLGSGRGALFGTDGDADGTEETEESSEDDGSEDGLPWEYQRGQVEISTLANLARTQYLIATNMLSQSSVDSRLAEFLRRTRRFQSLLGTIPEPESVDEEEEGDEEADSTDERFDESVSQRSPSADSSSSLAEDEPGVSHTARLVLELSSTLMQRLRHMMRACKVDGRRVVGLNWRSMAEYGAAVELFNGGAAQEAEGICSSLANLLCDKYPLMLNARDRHRWRVFSCNAMLMHVFLCIGKGEAETALRVLSILEADPRFRRFVGLGAYVGSVQPRLLVPRALRIKILIMAERGPGQWEEELDELLRDMQSHPSARLVAQIREMFVRLGILDG